MEMSNSDKKHGYRNIIISSCAIAMALFQLYGGMYGAFESLLQRSIHLMFAVTLGFLLYPISRKKKMNERFSSIVNYSLSLISLIVFGYVIVNYDRIIVRLPLVSPLSFFDKLFGVLAIFILLELSRRVVGLALTIIVGVFLMYALVGPLLPRLLSHRGFFLWDVVDYLNFGTDGIYGIPLGVSATFVAMFIIFGSFLETSGAGNVIMKMGQALVGHLRGGPAKVAVLTSALFGTVSGSAVANVYTTGTFTIPMMKRLGYSSSFAGGVEACASTGGQIMPPIMGAAAFVMANLLGLPYVEICIAAIVPAILYFFSLFLMVDFESVKSGLRGLSPEEIPAWKDILKYIYLLVPIVILVYMIVIGFTPFRAAFIGILSIVALSFVRKETRFNIKKVLRALDAAGKRMVTIGIACATVGIIVGVTTLTGIGLNLSSAIVLLGKGSIFLPLILVMVSSIILGMGTPTVVAYIIAVILGAPALIKCGLTPLQAHMFVFYFAVFSMITPPVAIAAYAAAEIAKEDIMKTAIRATKIGFSGFLVPYLFVYNRALLLKGTLKEIVIALIVALTVVFLGVIALEGWAFNRKISNVERVLLLVSIALLIYPALTTKILGFIAGSGLILFFYKKP